MFDRTLFEEEQYRQITRRVQKKSKQHMVLSVEFAINMILTGALGYFGDS